MNIPQAILRRSRLFKFLIGGATTVGVEYASFYLLYTILDWRLIFANSVSFLCGLFVSFCVNRLWAFKEDSYAKRTDHQLLFFVCLAAFNLFMSNVIVGVLNYLNIDPQIGKIIAIVAVATWNYFIYKKFIFATANTK